MRTIAKGVGLIVLLTCQGLAQSYSDTAGESAQRNNVHSSSYYWKSESAAGTAQMLTFFCGSCGPSLVLLCYKLNTSKARIRVI